MGVQLFNMNVQVHIKENSILTFEKVGKNVINNLLDCYSLSKDSDIFYTKSTHMIPSIRKLQDQGGFVGQELKPKYIQINYQCTLNCSWAPRKGVSFVVSCLAMMWS